MTGADTIFALSSGPPPSAVAVIRVSGPDARQALCSLAGGVPAPRRAALRAIRDPRSGALIDRGLVLFFPGPGSATGEDIVEFQVHGGRAVIAALLAALSAMPGLRPAEAGEFAHRSFANGRADLTALEGLADLIAAETEAQRRQAVALADGGLGALGEAWRAAIIEAQALVEAELDFADEDDVPGAASTPAWETLERLVAEITCHLRDSGRGERLRDGLSVVIAGPPNAGKSSLMNALARRDVAIVTEEAGTTRDVIEIHLDLDGYPVRLADTAGIREAAGRVEREGIRRALERVRDADLVLWLGEPGNEAPSPDVGGSKIWRIASKADLRGPPADADLAISTVTGQGLDTLVSRLAGFAAERLGGDPPLIAHARQRAALEDTVAALGRALAGGSLEIRAEELRAAASALGRLTGHIDVEDVLGAIFARFCIGK